MKILICDDHAIIRKGLKQILLEEYASAEIIEAADAGAAINLISKTTPDVVICDLSMPGRSGLDVVHYTRQNFPRIPVLILSIHPEEQYALRVLKAGAAGYLNKDAAPEELVTALARVLQGRRYISVSIAEKLAQELLNEKHKNANHETLSDREFDVFKLIASGESLTSIAEKLSLSITTVSTYRSRILQKLKMKTNAELTRYAIENQLI